MMRSKRDRLPTNQTKNPNNTSEKTSKGKYGPEKSI